MGMANGPSIGIDVTTWQKSSHSGSGGGNCVEVGVSTHA